MKASKVEIIPTKRRLGQKNVGERGLFVHPDAAKIHVEVVGEARYVTADDEPKPAQTYTTRDMTAAPRAPRAPRVYRSAVRAATPEPSAQAVWPITTNTENEPE